MRASRLMLILYLFLLYWLLLTPSPPVSAGGSDKLGHVAMAVVLGLLVAFSILRFPVHVQMSLVLVVGLVLGVASEWIQASIPGRNPDAADLAANYVGTMVGALLLPLANVGLRAAERRSAGQT